MTRNGLWQPCYSLTMFVHIWCSSWLFSRLPTANPTPAFRSLLTRLHAGGRSMRARQNSSIMAAFHSHVFVSGGTRVTLACYRHSQVTSYQKRPVHEALKAHGGAVHVPETHEIKAGWKIRHGRSCKYEAIAVVIRRDITAGRSTSISKVPLPQGSSSKHLKRFSR